MVKGEWENERNERRWGGEVLFIFPGYGTGSGLRGTKQSQLAARELFPRERLISVAWVMVDLEPQCGVMHPGYKKVKSIIFATFTTWTHGSYTIFVGIFNLHTGHPPQPHARVRSVSAIKAGVGAEGMGYRQTCGTV